MVCFVCEFERLKVFFRRFLNFCFESWFLVWSFFVILCNWCFDFIDVMVVFLLVLMLMIDIFIRFSLVRVWILLFLLIL